ncbi:MAG TPA: quinolinate synthase NadA [Spirochaeta sp.]|nr:quinolinate synthase NadA [Spirochaeta sp.]
MIAAVSIYDRLRSCITDDISDQQLKEKAETAEEIIRLKREKNALILVHNYIDPLLFHSVADITGDSLELSRKAADADNDIIVVCGVSFMAETAKLLNPEKKVLLPVEEAGCSLAESISPEDVRKLKRKHPGVPVAAYINTYAELKAEIDICCTSGNVAQILSSLPNEQIIFLPDQHLTTNVAGMLGAGRELIGWNGSCEVHERFTRTQVEDIRRNHPDAVILAHPESPQEVIDAVDFAGGTSAMINYIQESDAQEFCLFSEAAMEKNIVLNDPQKRFIPVPYIRCPHMEKITLENTLMALREERYEIEIPEDIRESAAESVRYMLRIS